MDVNQFIQNVISGNAVEAKESLNDILSSRAFSSLDEYKKEIAQKLYATEEDVEVQDTADSEIEEDDLLTQEEFDSLSEEDQQLYIESLEQLDELSKTTLRNYLKGSRQENQGGLGSAGHMSDKARSLGRTDQDKEDGRYEGAKRAKRKLSQEEVEQIDEVGDTPAGKKMLGSYLKKRTKQIPGIERNYQMTPYEDGPMGAKTIKKFQKKVNKGMGRAIDRLTKEESEQIDEVSQKTAINAFVKRAGREEDDDSKSTKTMDRIFKKHGQKGVIKAANALDKEHRPFSSDYTKKDYISGVLAKHGADQNYDDRNKPSPKPSKGPVKGRGYA